MDAAHHGRGGHGHEHHHHPGRAATPELPGDIAAEAPEGTIYTCPMHPEIRQDQLQLRGRAA